MIKGSKGGSNTKTGLVFEGKVELSKFFAQQDNYSVEKYKYNNSYNLYYKSDLVGRIFKKYSFYKFLEEYGINWRVSCKMKCIKNKV